MDGPLNAVNTRNNEVVMGIILGWGKRQGGYTLLFGWQKQVGPKFG
jgi:hypothetical protein